MKMKPTKEQLFEAALALNGDDKKYVITVEENKIVTRVKWMDAVFFSPASISDEMREFEYTVEINDDGTYSDIEKHTASDKGLNRKGLNFNKSVQVGHTKTYHRTIGFGVNKETGELGIIDNVFNSEEYKDPVRTLIRNSGYKRKAHSSLKFIIPIVSVLLVAMIVAIIIAAAGDSKRVAITSNDFESIATSHGYSVQISETAESERICIATNEQAACEITFYVLGDQEHAKSFFKTNKAEFEVLISTNTEDFSASTSSGSAFEKYSATSDKIYLYIARTENTVLIVSTDIENKAAVQELVKAINY